ncbi:MAG: hypothetical protein IPG17_33175 [Sandaracinaceae bacterium]|nr:hypothetical protein [Sandaracinaceae bacterium]
MDAVVIDVKDSNGRVAIDTRVPALRTSRPLPAPYPATWAPKLAELKAAGVYTIARVVCLPDNQLPRRRRTSPCGVSAGRAPWVSAGTGGTTSSTRTTRRTTPSSWRWPSRCRRWASTDPARITCASRWTTPRAGPCSRPRASARGWTRW